MPTHKVTGSDHISSVAAKHGFVRWQTIWDANPSLKSKRKDPNKLFHGDRYNKGDTLTIPGKDAKKKESGATDKTHKFKIESQKVFLRLRILKEDFTPLKNAVYQLQFVGGSDMILNGKTDDKGQIEREITRTNQLVRLIVRTTPEDNKPPPPKDGSKPKDLYGPGVIDWILYVGRQNAIMENAPDKWCISGVQQRLNNLNINSGPIDGIRGPVTTAAVKAFQKLFGLKDDGKPGQGETQPKLQKVHDDPDSIVPLAKPGA